MASPVAAEASAPPLARKGVGAWPMWLLGIVIMVDAIDQNIVRGVVTQLKEDPRLALSDLQVGILLSCFVLVNGLITVPAGYLADRWNRTRTIGHTIVGWSALTAFTGLMPNFASLVAIRSALGFGQAITEPSAASLLGDYYPQAKRGIAFSIQQALLFVGFGLGIGLGGLIGNAFGWRWAFLVVGTPGVIVALLVYRLKEPRRGAADRAELTGIADVGVDEPVPLFEHGLRRFMGDLVDGLRADARTILQIKTMRYALVGVSSLLFTITAIGAALPQFYERSLHVQKGAAEGYVGLLVVLGGIPGVLLGGRVADRYMDRIKGARMAIPAICILSGNALFVISYLRLPFAVAYPLEIVGFLLTTMAIPALRAGLTDAVPANLRGAGFGFFNLASVLFGQAAAPLLVFAVAGAFGGNLRTAFLILSPPVFIGGAFLYKARNHMDEDAAKIFEAIVKAITEQQERDAADAAEAAAEAAPPS